MAHIFFLDSIYPVSKCVALASAQKRPIVVSFYVKAIPETRLHTAEIYTLEQEILKLKASIDANVADPKTNVVLEEKTRNLVLLQNQIKQIKQLLDGYTRQWRAPNALHQYRSIITFLMMPIDIEDTVQANFIASNYGVTRIPALCGITHEGIIDQVQRRLDPSEFVNWAAELLEKCNVKL